MTCSPAMGLSFTLNALTIAQTARAVLVSLQYCITLTSLFRDLGTSLLSNDCSLISSLLFSVIAPLVNGHPEPGGSNMFSCRMTSFLPALTSWQSVQRQMMLSSMAVVRR